MFTPLAMQQNMLLQRNLVYPGITRGKKLVVLMGNGRHGDGGQKQPNRKPVFRAAVANARAMLIQK